MPAKRGMWISGPIGIIGDGCDWKSNPGFAGHLDCRQGVDVHVRDVCVCVCVYVHMIPFPSLPTYIYRVGHHQKR